MRVVVALTLILTAGGYLAAQTDPAAITDGFTPAAIAPGTPQGVTLLSPHEAVNYYNGNLALSIPLNSVQGRGGAGYKMILPIGTKWVMENHPNGYDVFAPVPSVFPYEGLWMDGAAQRYTPGRMVWREVVDESAGVSATCTSGPSATYSFYYGQTLTRLTWIEADGTEHEFQDALSAGSPLPPSGTTPYNCASDRLLSRPSRGTVFVSDDATAATFIADATVYDWITPKDKQVHFAKGIQGWLLFKDGTRYQTDSNGNVIQMIDRLGNTTTISGGGTIITDSLGRITKITYANTSSTSPVFDTIVYPAADGNTHTITINYDLLQNHLKSGWSLQTHASLFATSNANDYSSFNPLVVNSVVLPDNSSYTILYNSYGEVAQVNLPTGGFYQYDYPATTPYCNGSNYAGCAASSSNGYTNMQTILRRVTARRVYANGGTLEGQACYSPTFTADGTTTQVTFYDGTALSGCGSGNVISSETHSFRSTPIVDLSWVNPPSFWYPEGFSGREVQTTWNTAGGTALKTVSSTWGYNSTGVYSGTLPSNQQTWFNLTACQALTMLSGASPATFGKFFLYDKYFNTTDTYEYDFGAAPSPASSCPQSVPTGFGRRTHLSYLIDGVYDVVSSPASGPNSNHIRNLVQEGDTYNGPGVLAAQTKYGYDETTPTSAGTSLGYTTPTHSKLGNLTSKSVWLNTNSSYWQTTFAFDNLGNVLSIKDPRQNSTTIGYVDNCSTPVPNPPAGALSVGSLRAFPTTVTNANGQTASIQYDCYLGKQKQLTDANSAVTTYTYSGDPFDRLIFVQQAFGRPEEAHTAFSYPNLTTVTTSQDQKVKDDGLIATTSLFDGFGRPKETRRFTSGSAYISVTQDYDGKGRPWRTSLPYTPGSETQHFVTTTYDGADRVLSVATDDGAATTTAYSGNQTTTADSGGAARTVTSDGYGRVQSVLEDPGGKNYSTSYAYDVLDDLTLVTQSAQTRSFTYNSLRQLVSATNPESGTICYGATASPCTASYDGNGNLLYRTDARGITTSYTYDALNRVSSKTYSDSTTPAVSYTYDDPLVPCSIGRLTKTAATALGSIPAFTSQTTSYDCLGRPKNSAQTIGTNPPYTFGYTYNLAGGLLTETYPSLRVVSTAHDDRLNRATGLTGQMGTTASTYVKLASYASNGAISQLQFGPAPLATENITFDQGLSTLRGQPTALSVTLAGGTNLLTLGYGYCPGKPAPAQCASNNGNVQSASISAPGSTVNVWQSFLYDKVNRLTSAIETPTSGSSTPPWTQIYDYDTSGFGNRWLDPASSGLSLSPFTPQYSTNFNANNQLVVQSSTYDTAGNQKTIGGFSYNYDAENRVSLVTEPSGTNPPSYQYFYDGAGRRIQKVASGGTTTTYVYDAAGEIAAEYSSTASTPNCSTCFVVQDTLGSTRLMFDATTGNPVALHDYLPFGEELVNVRPSLLYSGNDNPRQKFTGKERDSETNLDYFGARYFSGAQGRFTSPDPKLFTARHLANPQKWNKYAYVRNNPLILIDPDGLDDWYVFRPLISETQPLSRTWSNAVTAAEHRGDHVHMFQGKNATVEEYNKATAEEGAHVLAVSHFGKGQGDAPGLLQLSNGVSWGSKGSESAGPQPAASANMSMTIQASSSEPIAAKEIAIIGCESVQAAPEYSGTTFFGMHSPAEEISAAFGSQAAAAFLTAGGGQAGVGAVDNVFKKSPVPEDKGATMVEKDPVPGERPQ